VRRWSTTEGANAEAKHCLVILPPLMVPHSPGATQRDPPAMRLLDRTPEWLGSQRRHQRSEGLDAFLARGAELAEVPMNAGPFAPFLTAPGRVQAAAGADQSMIRAALVTARNAPATKRVVKALRTWDGRADVDLPWPVEEGRGSRCTEGSHLLR
jgi:hypothetical protein